jgi:hypothetical protein
MDAAEIQSDALMSCGTCQLPCKLELAAVYSAGISSLSYRWHMPVLLILDRHHLTK